MSQPSHVDSRRRAACWWSRVRGSPTTLDVASRGCRLDRSGHLVQRCRKIEPGCPTLEEGAVAPYLLHGAVSCGLAPATHAQLYGCTSRADGDLRLPPVPARR